MVHLNREVRRKDREITDLEECKEIIRNNNLGLLSTISEDNTPYIVPLNYFYDGETIYFHSAIEGHKIDNIKKNPMVCFCVVGQHKVNLEKFTTSYESVMAFGKAEIVADLETKIQVLNGMMKYLGREVDVTNHYKINVIEDKTAIIKIEISRLTGKRNVVK